MSKLAGRPLKYRNLIEVLGNDEIYSPASIVNNGVALGLVQSDQDEVELKSNRIKIRHTLARFAKNHGFPPQGDGSVVLPGQSLARGWEGRRWKDALPEKRGRQDQVQELEVATAEPAF